MPSIVNMPMRPNNTRACVEGRKTATSRPTKYGNPGDFFRLMFKGKEYYFKITEVRVILLSEVAEEHFKEEGFNSSTEFISEWWRIHPNKGYKPNWQVWFHQFERHY